MIIYDYICQTDIQRPPLPLQNFLRVVEVLKGVLWQAVDVQFRDPRPPVLISKNYFSAWCCVV